jgi:regulator of protease activity HflC (stomatin/prohibitin superfamily)
MMTIVFSILLFIILFIGLSLEVHNNNVSFRFRKRSLFAFLSLLIILGSMYAQVNANEVGIVYDPFAGGIQDEALGEGLHFKTPLQEVKTISTKLREETYTVTAQTGIIIREDEEGEIEETGGGQWATYQVTIQYKVEVANAHKFYRQFGGDVVPTSTIEARLRESLQESSVQQDIFSILKGGLNDVRNTTEIGLSESLLELGITVEAFIILDVDAGVEIEQVVRDEATAAKQKEIAVKEQEAELIRKETERLSAEIIALTVVIEAEADAEAQRILNSVTASAIYTMYEGQFLDDAGILDEALKTTFETAGTGGYLTIQEISDIVIKQLYYDTWDGMLPEVLTGTDTDIIIAP